MREYFYTEKGISYRTNDFKPGQLTLVFIHGVSSSSSAWFEFEEIFEKQYNVLTYDIRGHGKSLKYPKSSDYEIKNFADDLFDLLKYVGVQKCVLISHSFGTFVAREFLVEHQDLLSGVIFLSPGMSMANKVTSKVARVILSLARIFELFPLGRKTASRVDYIKYKGTGEFSLSRFWADVSRTGLRAYLFSIARIYYFDRDDFLEKIDIPTLIIHGKKDTYISINDSLVKEKIKNSEFVILENANHIIVLNNVKEVADAISGFIQKIKF